MYLEKLGICGWGGIEPAILSSILSDLPVLFLGKHGTNKTEGAEVIARAVWGNGINFRPYMCPLLTTEDLLGWPDPSSLQKGEVRYAHTPLSIWDVDVALWDELNRSNPLTASKIIELVRTRKIMGQETKLKFSFSAINPPGDYESTYLPLALASRFVSLEVPSIEDLKDSDVRAILEGTVVDEVAAKGLRKLIRTAKKFRICTTDEDCIMGAVHQMEKALRNLVYCSARQLKGLLSLLRNAEKLHRVGYPVTVPQLVVMVMGCLPECFGIVTKDARRSDVESTLRNVLVKMNAGMTPMASESKLLELVLEKDIADQLSWANTVSVEGSEASYKILKRAISVLNKRTDLQERFKMSVLISLRCSAVKLDDSFMDNSVGITGLYRAFERTGGEV